MKLRLLAPLLALALLGCPHAHRRPLPPGQIKKVVSPARGDGGGAVLAVAPRTDRP